MNKYIHIVVPIFFSLLLGQGLNQVDLKLAKLKIAVETASRSSQKVFVEDFTGLL